MVLTNHTRTTMNSIRSNAGLVLVSAVLLCQVHSAERFHLAILASVSCSLEAHNISFWVEQALEDITKQDVIPEVRISHEVFDVCTPTEGLAEFVNIYTGPDDNDIDAFVGPTNHYLCEPAARLASYWEITMVSWGCTGSTLSDKSDYPTFARTVQTNGPVGEGLARILEHFRWKYSVIVTSSDARQLKITQAITEGMRKLNLYVEKTVIAEQNTSVDFLADAFSRLNSRVKGNVLFK